MIKIMSENKEEISFKIFEKIPHSIICTKCNCGYSLDEIVKTTKHSVYYTCPKCESMLLIFPIKYYKNLKE